MKNIKDKKRNKKNSQFAKFMYIFIFLVYFIFLGYAYIFNFPAGIEIGNHFFSFFIYMLKILPCAFVLIGLFEVWVPREKVEKHLGSSGGFQGYIWAILLAGTIAGGLLVALPVSSALYHKGARLSVIFTFIGASAIVRIPMTLFEVSFLGMEFTIIRWFISIPLVIISSVFLEKYLQKQKFSIR